MCHVIENSAVVQSPSQDVGPPAFRCSFSCSGDILVVLHFLYNAAKRAGVISCISLYNSAHLAW